MFNFIPQIKKPWRRANFPMVSDRVIQEKLKEAKNKYQEAVHHKGRAPTRHRERIGSTALANFAA